LAFAHPGMTRRFGGEIAPPEVKFSFWASMADLGRLVMRSGAPQLRLRIAVALGLVFAGKLAGVIAPVMMGDAIDTLRPVAQGGIPIGATFVLFALAYAGLAGVGRVIDISCPDQGVVALVGDREDDPSVLVLEEIGPIVVEEFADDDVAAFDQADVLGFLASHDIADDLVDPGARGVDQQARLDRAAQLGL